MHNHGYEYRAKIVDGDQVQYSDWFDTEDALHAAMRHVTRDINKLCFCEARMVQCTEQGCDVDRTPRVISTL
jgi:hypothetical protein